MIKLLDGWNIDADENCFTLKRITEKEVDGETKQSTQLGGYYRSLEDALDGFRRLQARKYIQGNDISLNEAVASLRKQAEEIRNLAKGL